MSISDTVSKFSGLTDILACPICRKPFEARGASLVCCGGHTFDMNKRGYVNMAPQAKNADFKYDAELFAARRRVLSGEFYLPVMSALSEFVKEGFAAADVGCGEGSYLKYLSENSPSSARLFGFDLSRDGVAAAAPCAPRAAVCVADLRRLPVADGSLDIIFNVLTGADYAEFGRALKDGGRLVKVVPAEGYLKEIRALVKDSLIHKQQETERVEEYFRTRTSNIEKIQIRNTFSLSADYASDFLKMTPMTFGGRADGIAAADIKEITIALDILSGQPLR
ncbi:MAG: methyltransferase domain-containing protein [Eubacteriales bacterium]|nr:methyltransferase domain-containing protein [Eubacteriales bacterium]MDD3881585.1 methyltransferase domain-containing protein [Eubacteriales bacterium]MDD4512356.1 methyltransferase domain-containing protein [Eubacteriales bacterium]